MLPEIVPVLESILSARSPDEASQRFFGLLEPLGATYLQTRLYRRPRAALTAKSHWAAGGVLARNAPEGWVGSSAFNYVCFDQNPLLGAIRQSRTRYRFSDFAPFSDPTYGAYWDAMSEAGIADALCATSYGPDRSIASLHLGFSRREFDADEGRMIHMAGLLLTERLMDFAAPRDNTPTLTTRERDCLAYVADGYTDAQIAMLLEISESTVRFHLTNARTKLGAVNRTQAVARLATSGLL
jgi:LuxR family transcriptional regulator, quorum-sensing system regulator BjaR1